MGRAVLKSEQHAVMLMGLQTLDSISDSVTFFLSLVFFVRNHVDFHYVYKCR